MARGRFARGAVALAVLVVSGCIDYPVRFERVDQDQLRVLDFMYVNISDTAARLCEAAPGDSMLLVACFAGKPVSAIDFEVSWNVMSAAYGDTAYDRGPLQYVSVDKADLARLPLDLSTFTDSTEIAAIRFRVPDNVLAISSSVSATAIAALGLDKGALLAAVDSIARLPPFLRSAVASALPQGYVGMALQMLSAPVRIFVTVNGVDAIRSDFTVRYNRLFRGDAALGGVCVNRNPAVSFIGVYKVKGAKLSFGFGDLGANDSVFCLYNPSRRVDAAVTGDSARLVYRDTILIDLGYSYYVATDTGVFAQVDTRDSGRPLVFDAAAKTYALSSARPESQDAVWFFELDAAETAGTDDSRWFTTEALGNYVCALFPSLTPALTHATLWVQAYDFLLNEWQRPSGSTLLETQLHFRYSQAYLDSIKGL